MTDLVQARPRGSAASVARRAERAHPQPVRPVACYSAAMRWPLLSLFILTAGLTGCAPSGGGRATGADMSLDPPTTDAMPPTDMA